jgi:hypothetical protein
MEARCSRDVVLLIRPQYKTSARPSCLWRGRTVRRSVLGDHRHKELLSSVSVTGRPELVMTHMGYVRATSGARCVMTKSHSANAQMLGSIGMESAASGPKRGCDSDHA